MARVAPSVSGGAEQVLLQLDTALQTAGHRSLVVACAGSQVAGQLVESCTLPEILDESAQDSARRAHAEAISKLLSREHIDVVHMHGVDFHHYLPESGPPVCPGLLPNFPAPSEFFFPPESLPRLPRGADAPSASDRQAER